MRRPLVPDLVAASCGPPTGCPASNAGNDDTAPAGLVPPIAPPAGGTIFRVADFPPDSRYEGVDIEQMFREIGGADAHAAGNATATLATSGSTRPHTLDYAIVLDGEIWALVDVGECLLAPGDVLIQRGTNHAWSNRSDRPCRVAFVLIDALPDGD